MPIITISPVANFCGQSLGKLDQEINQEKVCRHLTVKEDQIVYLRLQLGAARTGKRVRTW